MVEEELTVEEREQLLALARETLDQYLSGRGKPDPDWTNPILKKDRGVFVTLHNNGRLRGCIGYPLPVKSLGEAVVDNAISAASEDPRFPPVRLPELPDIDIEISVLTPPTKLDNISDIRIGHDGIIISKGHNKGLFLPQVPVEQGWDLEQYLTHGCMKAGLDPDEWKRGITIEVFQAQVFAEKEKSR